MYLPIGVGVPDLGPGVPDGHGGGGPPMDGRAAHGWMAWFITLRRALQPMPARRFNDTPNDVLSMLIYKINGDIQSGNIKPVDAWDAMRTVIRKELGRSYTDRPPLKSSMARTARSVLGDDDAG